MQIEKRVSLRNFNGCKTMTKTEAMQNALGTICVAEIEKDVNHYMFSSYTDGYAISMFTGSDREVAERVLDKFRHGFVDGTSMEIHDLEGSYSVHVEWEWQ